jgi:hypothetical protein
MTPNEFWAAKSPLPEYHAITFDHPAFDAPIRLVANKFAAVTLDGNSYTPAPMSIKPPDQTGGTQAKLSMTFPRVVVGRQFKQQIKLVAGSREPITVLYAVYLDDLNNPALSWSLYVSDAGGVTFSPDAVQVTATDDNPLRRRAGVIYEPSVFTGLESI